MNRSIQAEQALLNMLYKSFQWYSDRLSSTELNGIDDAFVEAYDAKDVNTAKYCIRSMSELLHNLTDGDMAKADTRKAYRILI